MIFFILSSIDLSMGVLMLVLQSAKARDELWTFLTPLTLVLTGCSTIVAIACASINLADLTTCI
jgi:hypothetical protein